MDSQHELDDYKENIGKWQNNTGGSFAVGCNNTMFSIISDIRQLKNKNDLLPHALTKIKIRFLGGFISQVLFNFQIVVVTNLW